MRPQICAEVAAPPSKYPRFWGPTIFSKNYRKKTPLAFDYTRPYMPPRCYFHSDIPPGPSKTKESALKKPLHPCLTLTPYGNLTNHGTDTIRTSTSYGTGAVIITSELRYEGVRTTSGTTARTTNPHSYPGESQLRSAPAPVCLAPRPPGSSKKRT